MKNFKTRAINLGVSEFVRNQMALSGRIPDEKELPDEKAQGETDEISLQTEAETNDCQTEADTALHFQVFDVSAVAETFEIVESERMKKFCDLVFAQMFRKRYPSIVFGGPSGCGVTTLMQYISKRIKEDRCPTAFSGTIVYELFAEDFMDNDMSIISRKLCLVLSDLQQSGAKKAIIIIDNFENTSTVFQYNFNSIILGMEQAFGFDFLRFFLGTNQAYMEAHEKDDISFLSDSVVVAISAYQNASDVISELKYELARLSEAHGGIKCSREILEDMYFLTNSESRSDIIPYTAFLNTVDYLYSYTQLKGKMRVTRKEIEDVLATDFQLFNGQTKEELLLTANHEAGHTILALCHPEFYGVRGVRILPIDSCNIMGLSSVVFKYNIAGKADKNYIITQLAFYLAGRCAEKKVASGAMSDLERATEYAKDWVKQVGAFEKVGLNYYCNLEDSSEEERMAVEKETKELLILGFEKAKRILGREEKALNALVEALMKKPYLTSKEVMKIWKKYKSQ